MAVLPVQRTWTVGEKVTAAMLNDDVRDMGNFFLNAPTACVSNAAIAAATGGSGTYMTFSTEAWDNDGIHSTSALTGRLTCVTAGVYDIYGHLSYAGNATGTKRNLAIRFNGTTIPVYAEVTSSPDGANPVGVELILPYKLAVGEFVELRAFHDAGVALNVTPRFGMTWRSVG